MWRITRNRLDSNQRLKQIAKRKINELGRELTSYEYSEIGAIAGKTGEYVKKLLKS
jgi:hypothetical protein